ncbi:metal ABC transporter permease, partial [Escherichia coli]|uniref:metal ABC transporter permease n=1 Tax=Escherichia coli TaxID=562 RepID=UPI0035D0852D
VLLEPFSYEYMLNAMWVSAMVGGLRTILTCVLMLKGCSSIGEALTHFIVTGISVCDHVELTVSVGGHLFSGRSPGKPRFS